MDSKSYCCYWVRRFLLASLFVWGAGSAHANPYVFEAMRKEMPYGFERVTLPGSTFHLERGRRMDLAIPYGPRSLSKLFLNANTQGCALGDIIITAWSREDRSKTFEIREVPEWPNWYYLPFDEEDVHKIAIEHRCGSRLHVHVVMADLGPHAVDLLFNNRNNWDDGRVDFRPAFELGEVRESRFDYRRDLGTEIRRHIPYEHKYFYLAECLERLIDRMEPKFPRGDSGFADFANPLSELIEEVKAKALVQGDGSIETLEVLKGLRIQMYQEQDFMKTYTITPDYKVWAFAYRVIGETIDDEAHFHFRPEDFADGAFPAPAPGKHRKRTRPLPLPPKVEDADPES